MTNPHRHYIREALRGVRRDDPKEGDDDYASLVSLASNMMNAIKQAGFEPKSVPPEAMDYMGRATRHPGVKETVDGKTVYVVEHDVADQILPFAPGEEGFDGEHVWAIEIRVVGDPRYVVGEYFDMPMHRALSPATAQTVERLSSRGETMVYVERRCTTYNVHIKSLPAAKPPTRRGYVKIDA